jgi:hypothetical protein
MKKTVLLLLLAFTLSCSKDDSDNNSKEQGCYMKVLIIDSGMINNDPTYKLHYGTSNDDRVELDISREVYEFYKSRMSNGNDHWIGEVDHQ